MILESLNELKKLDVNRTVFGSDTHNYELYPPANEAEVLELEQVSNVSLPDDYRHFITQIGNGGAGPAYGLFRVGEHDDNLGFISFKKGCLLGDLSTPFKHSREWNHTKEFWDRAPDVDSMNEQEFEEACDHWRERLNKEYYDTSIMDGAIPICHLGCAIRDWLVVTGLERGNIWRDERAHNSGIYPLENDDGERLTFSVWYDDWISESLVEVRDQ